MVQPTVFNIFRLAALKKHSSKSHACYSSANADSGTPCHEHIILRTAYDNAEKTLPTWLPESPLRKICSYLSTPNHKTTELSQRKQRNAESIRQFRNNRWHQCYALSDVQQQQQQQNPEAESEQQQQQQLPTVLHENDMIAISMTSQAEKLRWLLGVGVEKNRFQRMEQVHFVHDIRNLLKQSRKLARRRSKINHNGNDAYEEQVRPAEKWSNKIMAFHEKRAAELAARQKRKLGRSPLSAVVKRVTRPRTRSM